MQVVTGRIEMTQIPPHIIEVVLDEGPFPRALVEKWPHDVQDDYFALMELDIQSLGIDEFRRLGRALGEAYLLSLHRPLESDPNLLEAWKVLTGTMCPPKLPEFGESSS